MLRLLVAAVALLLVRPAHAATADRELVILLLVDALRADHVGAYGYDRPTTPNLDALAKEGAVFERAYVNAPWTRPSTTSYLTGLNASRHRTESAKTKLPADVRTLAERVKQAGWATAGFTANGNGGSLAGLERGFDKFEDPTKTYTKDNRGVVYNNLPTGDFMVARVLGHLESSKAKREFLFVFLVDPHDPYGARPELEQLFLPPGFKGEPRRRALWEFNNDYSAEERAGMMAIYDAGIRQADEAIGKLVDGLRKLGAWDKTTLLVTADHGEGFGEHGFYLHAHHFWEEVIHVPLIARGPKLAAGRFTRLADATDVAATVAELAGAKRDGLTGVSVLDPKATKASVISEYNEFGIKRQAIMDGRWKVIWQRPADEAEYMREVKDKKFFPSVSFGEETVHVFDLVADPKEKNNLAAAMPAEAKKLLDELRAFVLRQDKALVGAR